MFQFLLSFTFHLFLASVFEVLAKVMQQISKFFTYICHLRYVCVHNRMLKILWENVLTHYAFNEQRTIKLIRNYTHDLGPLLFSAHHKCLFSFTASKISINPTELPSIPLAPPAWALAESKPPSRSAWTTTDGLLRVQSPQFVCHITSGHDSPFSEVTEGLPNSLWSCPLQWSPTSGKASKTDPCRLVRLIPVLLLASVWSPFHSPPMLALVSP